MADLYIQITGPNRCLKHNTALRKEYDDSDGHRGAYTEPDSFHVLGKAADHSFYDRNTGVHIKPQDMYDYYDKLYPTKFGVGVYINRIHLDVGARKARWDRR